MGKVTYKKAGVDINKANQFVKAIRAFTKGIGGFGGLYGLNTKNMRKPFLVASTDGVGTKLKIAQLTGKHNSVGIDLVAMSVNDLICTGAKPLFFLDYIACGKLDKDVLLDVIRGIASGCRDSGCSLIGGETAEMPGFYKSGEYDLAGFAVGIVDKSKIINGKNIKPRDLLIGIESNGLHSNGYSLVRKVFSKKELKKYSVELLKPTRVYVKPVMHILSTIKGICPSTIDHRASTIKGIAHITGGGFYDKLGRILPRNVDARINKGSWPIPKIFKLIQKKGGVPEREMYKTFNMGIGMVLVVRPDAASKIRKQLAQLKFSSWIMGEIIKGKGEVKIQ